MRKLGVLFVVLSLGTARADEDRLVTRARAELDALDLETARKTLEEALAAGMTSPDDTRAIYVLLGEVAASMGDPAGAEQHFRRALSLAPGARLARDTSPKISGPFEAARAWVGRAGPLRVSLSRPEPGVAVLVVAHDPLRLVAGARARWRDRDGVGQDVQGGGPARTRLALPADASIPVVVTAVDARGNALAELAVRAAPTAVPSPPAAVSASDRGAGERSFAGRWELWGAAAVLLGGAAGAFAIDAFLVDRRIDARNAASEEHEFHEVAPLERRVRRDLVVAQIGLGAALGCAAVAVFVASQPGATAPSAALAPVPVRGGLVMTAVWSWDVP